ncbi:hypothetical protein AAMO2058_001007400 [Amorphochlora amoebiformis]
MMYQVRCLRTLASSLTRVPRGSLMFSTKARMPEMWRGVGSLGSASKTFPAFEQQGFSGQRRGFSTTKLFVDVRGEEEALTKGMLKESIIVTCNKAMDPKAVLDTAIEEGKVPEASAGLEVIVYCNSGGRAGRMAAEMKSRGYNVTAVGGYKDFVGEYGSR